MLRNDLSWKSENLSYTKFKKRESELRKIKEEKENENRQVMVQNDELKEEIADKERWIMEFKDRKQNYYYFYKKYLHNKMQELKGNIRVFCRVRPPLPEIDRLSEADA